MYNVVWNSHGQHAKQSKHAYSRGGNFGVGSLGSLGHRLGVEGCTIVHVGGYGVTFCHKFRHRLFAVRP